MERRLGKALRGGLGLAALVGALASPAGAACPGKIVHAPSAGFCTNNPAIPCTHPGQAGCPGGLCTLPTGGRATFYDFTGMGACGVPYANPSTAMIAAINEPEYAGAKACGRCLRITGPLGTAVVQVADLCPFAGNEQWCGVPGHLDLSPAAFAAVADQSWGVVAVGWESIACPVTGNLQVAFQQDANPWWVALQMRQGRYSVDGLDLWSGGSWHSLPRQPWGYFIWEPGGNGDPGPYTLRITDENGAQVTATGVAFAAGSVQPTTVQMPICWDLFGDGFETTLTAWSRVSPGG